MTFGYAPQSKEEYEELGLEPPTKFQPYHVSISRQGLDIILHNRVILFHQLSEVGLISTRHNDYNHIRGEIDLLEGFHTAITKNAIIADIHFRECMEKIREILHGEEPGPEGNVKQYLRLKTYPDQIPEKLLRDRLGEWLSNNPVAKKADVKQECVIEGIEGYIDILADGEAWEIKINQAKALDVYQLFMYMDVGKIQKGFLIAPDWTTGAEVAADHINKQYGKQLELSELEKFPISHPPNAIEREEYY